MNTEQSTQNKNGNNTSPSAVVIGRDIIAAQTALSMAQLGIEVKLIVNTLAFGWISINEERQSDSLVDQRYFWPLILRAIRHPLVTLYCGTEVEAINRDGNIFKLSVVQQPRYVNPDLCTGCGRCQEECSVKLTALWENKKITHSAIHKPLLTTKSVPSAYIIDKNYLAPCNVACPLGINVQGFISLIANGKIDRAAELIAESVPLSGILGRVCKHPCEASCNRGKLDTPVSIRALHRFAADNGIVTSAADKEKSEGAVSESRTAIIGSGPAGLTAAWELKRRGYSPTVFESHGVIGGMLATGIPRFRLPREVREKEMEVIEKLGLNIRTGITVGRDVTFTYLKERGFKAFFLSIGTQRNNKLNIPGEDLHGVVDCMSLLLTLNLKVDTFVGTNVVIIGDGNTAVDSARATIRWNKGTVKILSWTVPEELTASEDEVAEALQEGIAIEYQAIPVEIIGDGGKVVGVRCQRTMLTEEIMPNGRHRPKAIPGTDFTIEADHVIVAVGQSADAIQLGIEGLGINKRTGVIRVNPLTLETNIPGVFAGGDCVTGPNNVVEAMADGLRAAESIDRYLQNRDLTTGRTLEPGPTAEIDFELIEPVQYDRAIMPVISTQDRIDSFEETTTGLSPEMAYREAQRCLNCAYCSQCMECKRICQVGAVFHVDEVKHFEFEAQSVIQCVDTELLSDICDKSTNWSQNQGDVTVISYGLKSGLATQLNTAMAVALSTAIEIKSSDSSVIESKEKITDPSHFLPSMSKSINGHSRTGVVLCRCGNSISDILDFPEITRALLSMHDVVFVDEIPQACTIEGATQIAYKVSEAQLTSLIIAGCRCCNLEQVCYSCSDRRVMCQEHLREQTRSYGNVYLEFVNIREHCAWVHREDRKGATKKALKMISAGIINADNALPIARIKSPVIPSVLVIGDGEASIIAAQAIAAQGYKVEFLAKHSTNTNNFRLGIFIGKNDIEKTNLKIRPWPVHLEVCGIPGRYEVVLEGNPIADPVGAVLVDVEEVKRNPTSMLSGSSSNILGRMLSRLHNIDSNNDTSDLLKEITLGETTGLFLLSPKSESGNEKEVVRGLAAAARVSAYLDQGDVTTRAMAVNIDIKACRGCGDCAALCPYIEMRERDNGIPYAFVDGALCIGCGLCVSLCDTGAIIQPAQSDKQIKLALESILTNGQGSSKKQRGYIDSDIVVFACNWDGWSCLETASYLGLSYPASVKPIRVRCLSRVHAGLILKAFELGAAGVLLIGCETGNCHFNNDDSSILGEYQKARQILQMLGINKERLVLTQLPAFDGHGFVTKIMEMVATVRGASDSDYTHTTRFRSRSRSKVKTNR